MDELTILRTVPAVTTVIAAAMVAANWNARIAVAGFVILIGAPAQSPGRRAPLSPEFRPRHASVP